MSGEVARRPGRLQVVLGMYAGMERTVLRTADRERLAAVADLVAPGAFRSWEGDDARAALAVADVLLGHWGCPRLTPEVLDRAPRLRLVAYGGGTSTVGQAVGPEVPGRGIVVTTAADANAVPVAEYAVGAILLAGKDAFRARDRYRAGEDHLLWSATLDRSFGNYRARIGIIGASRVGRRVIELLAPYDLEVVVSDPTLTAEDAAALGVALVDLDELFATSAVVSIHAPALPSTIGMVDARRLASMPEGATLINTARGSLVDPVALEVELVSGRISAVLDVTEPEPLPRESPLWGLPNVFLTPHTAGSQGRELARLTDLALTEIERYARGEPPLHPIVAEDLERIEP